MIGFDYTARIDPAALKAAGCGMVIRYFTPQAPAWPKSIRTAEARELLAAGFPIVVNYETAADRMKGGAAAGTADALALLADLAAIGAPTGLTAWVSADWDVQPSEVILVLDYLDAFAAAMRPRGYSTGLYGGFRAVAAAADAGYPIWQTVAWSNGRWDLRAVARQTGQQLTVGGVQVDVNEILNPGAMGAWTPQSAPAPTPSTEDDMPVFAQGEIPQDTGEHIVLVPPPNLPNGQWGNVWFSLGCDFVDGLTVRCAAWVHGSGWDIKQAVAVPRGGDRVNPWNGPLPAGTQKISVIRSTASGALGYLVEAARS